MQLQDNDDHIHHLYGDHNLLTIKKVIKKDSHGFTYSDIHIAMVDLGRPFFSGNN